MLFRLKNILPIDMFGDELTENAKTVFRTTTTCRFLIYFSLINTPISGDYDVRLMDIYQILESTEKRNR
jgi:hypothetical protein